MDAASTAAVPEHDGSFPEDGWPVPAHFVMAALRPVQWENEPDAQPSP